jgi:tetratricopeptide (TPR) repeat protein
LTEICLFDLYVDLNEFLLRQRESVNDGNIESGDLERDLSIQELLALLKSADNLEAANTLAMSIKNSWNAHSNPSLKLMLDIGTTYLANKKFDKALDILEKLVKGDPNYGEAWSKLSACYLILNQKNSSLEAANKALELIPQHLQALSVVAVLEMEAQRYQLGSTIIRKVLSLDPWSTLSTKLVISSEAVTEDYEAN